MEASRNYAVFHRIPLESVCLERLTRSLGGQEGWAGLTLREGLPSCCQELRDLLVASGFSREGLHSISQKNFVFFTAESGWDLPDLGSSDEEMLRWSLPSFALAKEGYEAFKGIEPGTAQLQDVIFSSAGVLGWEHYMSLLKPEALPLDSRKGIRSRPWAAADADTIAGSSSEDEEQPLTVDFTGAEPLLHGEAMAEAWPQGVPSSCP